MLGHSLGSSAGQGRSGPWKASESPTTSRSGTRCCTPTGASGGGRHGGRRRPTGVAQPADHRPGRLRQVDQPHTIPAIMPPVRERAARSAPRVGGVLEVQLLDDRQRPDDDVDPGLPAGGVNRGSDRHSAIAPGSSAPISAMVRPCQSPRWGLPQPLVHRQRQPDGLGHRGRGVVGAGQVRGDDPVEPLLREPRRDDAAPARDRRPGQPGVQVPLHPADGVVLGLPVPQQGDRRSVMQCRPGRPGGRAPRSPGSPSRAVQAVEAALLGVHDVHDDVVEVQQHPSVVVSPSRRSACCRSRAASPRPRRRWPGPDARWARRQHEAVGQRELVGHVERRRCRRPSCRRGGRGHLRQLDRLR